jgi:peroxiredoxin
MSFAYGATTDAASPYPRRITYVIGPEGRVEQAVAKVDVSTHAKTLLDSLPAPAK